MTQANLHVKIGADTEGFLGQMRRLDQSFNTVTRGVNEHGLALGKAQRVLETFAAQATGTNHVLGILATTISDFGAGAAVTTGALLGIGAIAVAYDKLTEGARKATEENEKFIASLVDQARATRAATVEGAQFLKLQADIALQAAQSDTGSPGWLKALVRGLPGQSSATFGSGGGGIADATTAAEQAQANVDRIVAGENAKLVSALSTLVSTGQASSAIQNDAQAVLTGLKRQLAMTSSSTAAGITSRGDIQGQIDQLQNAFKTADAPALAAAKAAAQAALDASKTYWNTQHELWMAATEKVKELNALAKNYLLENPASKIVGDSVAATVADANKLSVPSISINDGLTKEQIKQREKLGVLIDDSNKNANLIHDAIWGAAAASANLIVGALNIGGGGKGSQLGGAIGGTAGFAIGFALGHSPIGGAIGSTVGNLIGSAIGGLFDHHKKAVDSNTAALDRLTSAILNGPSGFKVASYEYQASDAVRGYQSITRLARQLQQRGGAVGFQLQTAGSGGP